MTGKRMKKLLMAKGISRNGAEDIRKHIRVFDERGELWTNAQKAESFFPSKKSSEEKQAI